MPSPLPQTSSEPSSLDPRRRILRAARQHLFTQGYASLTMEALAHELGMSKKTLYVHFTGKDALLLALFEEIGTTLRAEMEAVLANGALPFTQKLRGVIGAAATHIGKASPSLLRELQRHAPAVYERIEEMRQRTIPLVFSRLIRMGIAEKRVRPDIDPDFAAEFWLQAVRGLIQPAALERTGLSTVQMLSRAVDLYLTGLLTTAGRRDYERHTHDSSLA